MIKMGKKAGMPCHHRKLNLILMLVILYGAHTSDCFLTLVLLLYVVRLPAKV